MSESLCPTGITCDGTGPCATWQQAPDDWPLVGEHTATRLHDGRVLVVGDVTICDPTGCTTHGGALFDPRTDAWSAVASAPVRLAGRTATLLRDGRVVVVGGLDHQQRTVADVFVFDPESGAFTPGPSLVMSLGYHTATRLMDGRVVVVGGRHRDEHARDVLLSSVQIYDPVAQAWIDRSPLIGARERHVASLVGNAVVVAGGVGLTDGLPRVTAATEIYDPATDHWQVLGDLGGPAIGHTMTSLASGSSLLVVSNSAGAMTKTPFSTWEATGAMRWARSNHVATLLRDGRVLVAGGTPYQSVLTPEIYDPMMGTWSATCDQPLEITQGSATLLDDGRVLVIAGRPVMFQPPG
ncbi:MAG: kelch repeat-containing protein [Kofleriaceae bacterium]